MTATTKTAKRLQVFLLFILIIPLMLLTTSCSTPEITTATAEVESDSRTLTVSIDDGTTLEVPPGALPVGTSVSVSKLDPQKAPAMPEFFDSAVLLYDISADQSLQKEVKVKLALPEVGDDSVLMLFHYHDDAWEEVPFIIEGDYALFTTDSLSFWGWLDTSVQNFVRRADQLMVTVLSPDTYMVPLMSWIDNVTGMSSYTTIALENSSPLVEFDDSKTGGLISASAHMIEGNKLRLRVQNNNSFYLMINFEGEGSVIPQRGSYIDSKSAALSAPIMNIGDAKKVISEFSSDNYMLLPQGTAEFQTAYLPKESLTVAYQLDEISALYSSIDPLLSLVPVVDMEMTTALRDVMGAGSRYATALTDMESGVFESMLEITDFKNSLIRAGVLAGEKALRTMFKMLVLPAVVEIRQDVIENRAGDILTSGRQAKAGGQLILNYLEESPLVATGPGKQGNTNGNINNSGTAAEQGQWIYYKNFWNNNHLYKISTTGGSKTRLNSDVSEGINVLGDWIYYINYDSNENIYKIRTDSSGRIRLGTAKARFLTVIDNWIYYLNIADSKIYRMDTSGDNLTVLISDKTFRFSIANGWIYYKNDNDNGRIYKARLDDSEKIRINDDDSSYIIVDGDWIYYTNSDDGSIIYRIRTDGSGRTKLTNNEANWINLYDNWIYYVNMDDEWHIYRVRPDGSSDSLFHADPASFINIVSGRILYFKVSLQNDRGHYWVRTDSSGYQKAD